MRPALKSLNIFLALTVICSTYSLPCAPGYCQVEAQSSPKEVSEKSFALMKAGRSDEFAKLMLPSELECFKSALLAIADMAKSRGEEQKFVGLFEVPDRDSLNKLPPQQFLVRLMKRQFTPQVSELYSKATTRILGVINEGEIAHCIYILSIPEVFSKVSVVSLKKDSSGWGMLLTSDLDKVMQMLKVQYANQPGTEIPLIPELKRVKVLGSIMDGDTTAYVLVRSTTAINGVDFDKVSAIPFKKGDPEFNLLAAKDKEALEKSIQKELGALVESAKSANQAQKTTPDAQGKATQK